MPSRPLVWLSFLVFAAGCLGATAPVSEDSVPDVPRQGAAAVVKERPNVASVTFREDLRGEVESAQEADGRRDRDATLSYHGVHLTYDEWGRVVPAYVFRYDAMVYVIEDIEFLVDGILVEGHWETRSLEYLFDFATHRYLGHIDLVGEDRAFMPPDISGPLVWTYSGEAFLFMALHMLGGPQGSFVIWKTDDATYNGTFEPFDGEAHYDGDCTMYEFIITRDPPYPESVVPPGPADPAEERHDLVCLDDGLVPLWMSFGTPEDGLGYKRKGDSFTLPPPEGEGLPPLVLERHAWTPAAEVPGFGPMMVPPVWNEADWAAGIRDRADSLVLNAAYLKFRASYDGAYLDHFVGGWPPYAGLLLPSVPGLFDESSWLFLTSGAAALPLATPTGASLWADVHTRFGGPEEDDLHVADPNAYEFPSIFEEMDPANLPPLPAIGVVQDNVGPLAPVDPRLRSVWILQISEDMDPFVIWYAIAACFDGVGATPFLFVDGWTGAMMSAGQGVSHVNGCEAPGDARTLFPTGPRALWASAHETVLFGPDGLAAVSDASGTRVVPVLGVPSCLTSQLPAFQSC